MLVYNTSFHVEGENLVPEFLRFMRDEYVPRLLDKGHLKNPRFMRILTNIGDNMFAYSLMCDTDSVVTLKSWKVEIGNKLEAEFAKKYGEKIVIFSTTMNVVQL